MFASFLRRPPARTPPLGSRGFLTGLFGRKSSVPAIYKPRRERWITPTVVVVGCIPVLTFFLGTWQLQRLQWKVNLIDELTEKLQLAPLSLPRKVNLSVLPEFAWRKVGVKGRFDHAHTILIGPRVREGVHGVNVIVPLIREDGTTILVDRGFISNEIAKGFDFSQPDGEVAVLGMLRLSQPRNTFTPDNKPEKGEWYWVDVNGMAEFAGGEKANVQAVLVEEIFDGHAGDANRKIMHGEPVGRTATVNLRNSHLSYVITWFSLSALTTFMFLRLLRNRSKNNVRAMPRYGKSLF
ncbi:mitochondrial protein required for respiration [Cylindrobasidium torrendii FP15055 ss-10]|uniref:SURF1-like protein n=1 Tax=Cylindrobasidium torrendii FP15055 ss-10 TaxID=1314674 RepID=A0A0D7BF52_9AGAR|nr:mitochondrial protein required for respiration [Cylindrobasidium torrendii FP15055 ss-10]